MPLRQRTWLPIAMFVGGLALIGSAVAMGEAEVSLFLIFPVFSGSSGLFLLGTLLIILSFIVGFLMMAAGQLEMQSMMVGDKSARSPASQGGGPRKEFGGVVLVGPFPIAFGSRRSVALFMLVLGIVVAIILLGALALVA